MFRLKDGQGKIRVSLAVAFILCLLALVGVLLYPTMARQNEVSQYEQEVIREPRSPVVVTVVGAVLTVLTNALHSLSSLGQTFNSLVSKLPIPDELKEFLKFYGEELFETIDKEELKELKRTPIVTRNELKTVGISVAIMTIVLGFVEVNGFPYFLNLSLLGLVIPSVFLSVCIVIAVKLLSEFFHRQTFQVYRRLKLWNYGLAAFFISGFVFLFPFSSPLITRYQSGEISDERKAQVALSKMLMLLTLAIPFSMLLVLGSAPARFIGDAGLLLIFMLVCYSLVPLKPLPGKVIFNHREDVSLIAFVSTAFLFYSYTVGLLPIATYLVAGVISAFLVIVTLSERARLMLKRHISRIACQLQQRFKRVYDKVAQRMLS